MEQTLVIKIRFKVLKTILNEDNKPEHIPALYKLVNQFLLITRNEEIYNELLEDLKYYERIIRMR